MARKPLDLPPEVAKAFIEDLRAFFAEKNSIKRDEIAARQAEITLLSTTTETLAAAIKSSKRGSFAIRRSESFGRVVTIASRNRDDACCAAPHSSDELLYFGMAD